MRLQSIETTPNPNSMKFNLDGPVIAGAKSSASITYTATEQEGAPPFIAPLLALTGVKSVFACGNFLTLNRDPLADWKVILERASAILGGGDNNCAEAADRAADGDQSSVASKRLNAEKEGQVQVFVQTFTNIPIQVKVTDGKAEVRVSLGEKFDAAAGAAQKISGADFLKERFWADHGVRYGPLQEIADEVADEIRGTFDFEKTKDSETEITIDQPTIESLQISMKDGQWHKRLAAVQALSTLPQSDATLLLLIQALGDSLPQVRRLAAAALGTTGSKCAVEPLCRIMLEDNNIGVRRTAGDALSDIGDACAEPAACKALGDPNKLVRWRAARLLSDIGTAEALPFLQAATDDQEFEVRLEIEAAIQRISGGGQGLGPAWRRIIGDK
ncbi:MAG: virulence factor [Cyanobacteria bacterium REEB67]|nr:virulence factor [Cyanobacteria bacterium REEB67]